MEKPPAPGAWTVSRRGEQNRAPERRSGTEAALRSLELFACEWRLPLERCGEPGAAAAPAPPGPELPVRGPVRGGELRWAPPRRPGGPGEEEQLLPLPTPPVAPRAPSHVARPLGSSGAMHALWKVEARPGTSLPEAS
uniref:Uncharacterized protein n=1 Tax=Sphaerodactylus townsendi TaxID=933632 RepID=A0ACB8FFH7_9SAUR